jgi:hypothetical protein
MTQHDKATPDAETGYRQAREVEDMGARIWKLMVDLDLSQKNAVIDRLTGLVAMEAASHEPLQREPRADSISVAHDGKSLATPTPTRSTLPRDGFRPAP